MNTIASVVCFSVIVSLYAIGLLNGEPTSKDGAEASDKDNSQINSETKTHNPKYDVPKEQIERLKKIYEISEDPLGDYERRRKEYLEKYKTEYDYDNYDYGDEYDTDMNGAANVQEEHSHNGTDGNVNDTDTLAFDGKNDSLCPACGAREDAKKMRIEAIKNSILQKIGFSSNNLPNVTGKAIPQLPSIQRLIAQHQIQADAPVSSEYNFIPEDEIYGQVKRAYTIGQTSPEFASEVKGATYFELSESVTSRRLRDASLWVYLQPHDENTRLKEVYELYVYIIDMKAKPKNLMKGKVRYKKSTKAGWVEVKFSHIVHHWIRRPEANRGVIIQAFDSDGHSVAVTPEMTHDEQFFPLLEMSVTEHDDPHHRSKRFVNNVCDDERDRRTTCCRYPLRVDFVHFGWDWVIAPTGYMANYCSGECRHRHMVGPSATYLQTQAGGPSPCCTADKWYPLAMLYFDHKYNVLYTHMQKMIVERCTCT